jgi:hypothetical protein
MVYEQTVRKWVFSDPNRFPLSLLITTAIGHLLLCKATLIAPPINPRHLEGFVSYILRPPPFFITAPASQITSNLSIM